MKNRVVVAMSGGVDSSVAAALLKKAGLEVIGITMCFNLPDIETRRPRCCGLQGIEDARRVSHKLGIKHYVLNMKNVLEEKVIKDFCLEYLRGRTPNPCVRCNQYIKFDLLLKKAKALGAQYLATGHYARIDKSTIPALPAGRHGSQSTVYFLKKAKDLKKDQSYFLYRLGQNQLKHALFPLGEFTKEEVRKLARGFNLPVAEKAESQEICFFPENNYRAFLEANCKGKIKPGRIIDAEGKDLGMHRGVPFYTIGQREGLGLSVGYPIYVTSIDAKHNRITVGQRQDALKKEFLVRKLYFAHKPKKKKIALKVKIRYNHKESEAQIYSQPGKIKVRFKKPQFAITPGQSAVFYKKDLVLGGGIIDKVIN